MATREQQEGLRSGYLVDHLFYFQALFKHYMCIYDDLTTVSRNIIAHTYLSDNRNRILVATRELQELLKAFI